MPHTGPKGFRRWTRTGTIAFGIFVLMQVVVITMAILDVDRSVAYPIYFASIPFLVVAIVKTPWK